MSRNAVAKATGVSTWSVSKICAEAKPAITFDRTAIAVAAEARTIDLKALRVSASSDLLVDFGRLRERAWSPYTVKTTDGNGTVISYEVEERPARDMKDLYLAMAIVLDKHMVLDKYDSDARDLPAVDAWMAEVLGDADDAGTIPEGWE
jgi:hypothetical protein